MLSIVFRAKILNAESTIIAVERKYIHAELARELFTSMQLAIAIA